MNTSTARSPYDPCDGLATGQTFKLAAGCPNQGAGGMRHECRRSPSPPLQDRRGRDCRAARNFEGPDHGAEGKARHRTGGGGAPRRPIVFDPKEEGLRAPSDDQRDAGKRHLRHCRGGPRSHVHQQPGCDRQPVGRHPQAERNRTKADEADGRVELARSCGYATASYSRPRAMMQCKRRGTPSARPSKSGLPSALADTGWGLCEGGVDLTAALYRFTCKPPPDGKAVA